MSLWSFINDPVRVNDFLNPNYVRHEGSVRIDASSKHLRVWENMWTRYDPTYFPKKNIKYYY